MDFMVDRKTSDATKQAINELMMVKNMLAPLDLVCDLMVDVLMAISQGSIDQESTEKMLAAYKRLPKWDGETIGDRMKKAGDTIYDCLSSQIPPGAF